MKKLLHTIARYPVTLAGTGSLLLFWLDATGLLGGGVLLRALQLPAYMALYAGQIATGWLFEGGRADALWLTPIDIVLFFVPFVVLDVALRRAAAGPATPGRGAV
jgi:hypothetical protein